MWPSGGAFSAPSGLAALYWSPEFRQVQLIRRSLLRGPAGLHFGVLVDEGNGMPPAVYHLDKQRGILTDSIEDFARGHSWSPVKTITGSDAVEAHQRLQAIIHREAARPYDLFTWNCEHFARTVVDGGTGSHQVQFGFLGLFILGLYCLVPAN